MYAGAERVVASLWRVDDQATAQLMRHFYRGMLKENLRPAAALRAAQIEMSKSSRWSEPYYWAGFVIQGEWK
jgi:CHAT domain-containing protein